MGCLPQLVDLQNDLHRSIAGALLIIAGAVLGWLFYIETKPANET